MKTKLFISFVFVVLLIIIGIFYFKKDENSIVGKSPLNTEYKIDGKLVRLVNGKSEVPIAPDSATKIITSYFGDEARKDFDGDGREDSVFILTQETGGSGVFFYVVPAFNTVNGYIGGEAMLLGDRIAPQTIEIGKDNIIIVNYADRAPGESMTTPPSVGKTIWLKIDQVTKQFGVVAQNFEGEADISKMTLGMKSWNWIETIYNDGTEVKPNKEGIFSLTLNNDGRFNLKTDCNSVAGKYTVNQKKLAFSQMVSTQMFCENSQEHKFTEMLTKVQNYMFTSKGELVLSLAYDSGSIVLK